MCDPCKNGRHDECEGPECDCPKRREDAEIDRQVKSMSSRDAVLAESILSTLQGVGSPLARMIIEGAGRDRTLAFVHEIVRTAAALRC
jgi:hypothetical protein